MLINFAATNFRASSSIGPEKSTFPSADRIEMTLLAHTESSVELPNGADLATLEISFQIIGQARADNGLKAQLQPGSVGFLALICEPGSDPFAHGAMLWDGATLPYFLFQPGVSATVSLDISNIAERADWDEPYVWQPGKGGQLIIESASIESTIERLDRAPIQR